MPRQPGDAGLFEDEVSMAVAEDFKARVVPGEGMIAVESDLPGLGKK